MQVWNQIRERLKRQLPAHVYSSLVEPTTCTYDTPENVRLQFCDRFSKESFENKCSPTLREVIEGMNLSKMRVEFEIAEKRTPTQTQMEFDLPRRNPFTSRYSFETYIVGASNQFAHAACQAVAKQPGQCYNPLFILGGSGLGKTHLLKAIGYEIYRRYEDKKIHMLTSETFTNELIHAIRVDRMREFRDKYRNQCDVLLLDDVHFFAGKERTQEEFFYTFNCLHEVGKQIVITSDRYPKNIQGLENRLQTRFEWGLVADVQPPDIETRIAILKAKADDERIPLPDSAAQYIATHITLNIRELEGSLHSLQAYASMTGVPISVDLAKQVLRDSSPQTKHELTPEGILKLVALHFNVRTSELKSSKRVRKLAHPRQICMYLLRKHLLMSYPEIGKFIGGKDHSTVMHGVNKICGLLKNDTDMIDSVSAIESLIR